MLISSLQSPGLRPLPFIICATQAPQKTEETKECLASVRSQEIATVMKLFALACR